MLTFSPLLRCVLLLGALWSAATLAVETVSFRHLDSRNGLPQNSVPAVVQDGSGQIWLATSEGVHRYDGYQFRSYRNDPRDPNSLSDNQVSRLLVDDDGRIWIGTSQAGLNRLDPASGRIERFLPGEDATQLSHRSVLALHKDKDGQIWVATPRGLDRYDRERNAFQHYTHNPLDAGSAPAGAITAIIARSEGGLWLGHAGGVTAFDPQTGNFEALDLRSADNEAALGVTALWADNDGGLWIATASRGLFYRAPNAKNLRHWQHDPAQPDSLSVNALRALLRDRGGRLWIGTEGGGLNRLKADGEGFEVFRRNGADPHSLSMDEVSSLFEDCNGLLWIGTPGGGLNLTHPDRAGIGRLVHSPYGPRSLSDPFVWGIAPAPDGTLWVGTLRGLDQVDPRSGEVLRYSHFQTSNGFRLTPRVQSLTVDRKGRIWFGTVDGVLARFDPNTLHFATVGEASGSGSRFSWGRILMIHEDRVGRIWVSTMDGLVQLNAESLRVELDLPLNDDDNLPAGSVRVLAEHDGLIWLGTHSGGLQRLDVETQKAAQWSHSADDPHSLSHNTVRALHFDRNGDLWIGTMNGLNRWKAEDRVKGVNRFDVWLTADGLPNAAIYAIQRGNDGRLWLSTNAGIVAFDDKQNRFQVFDMSDGLPANEYNGLSSAQTADGRLWFGGTNGIAVLDPRRLQSLNVIGATMITSIHVRNEAQALLAGDTPLALDFDQNDLRISFAANDYREPRRNRFRWRLLGFKNDWVDNGARNEVSFTNLDPGDYTLEVKSANADGVWQEEPARLQISIAAPLWRRWYAWLFYALALSLTGWLLWRSHVHKLAAQARINEQLRRIDKLKDEFLANTSHELRTPLNGIIGVAESLRDGVAGELNDRVRDHLALIADSGRRLAHLVNEILDFKKLSHGSVSLERAPVDLQASVAVVLALSEPLAGNKALQLINAVPEDFPPVDADENRLEQILHNLIGNAIKFTEHGQVLIEAHHDANVAAITVSDTGIGIAAEAQERIFLPFEQVEESMTRKSGGTGLGLAVVRKLVELHGGQIRVQSKEGSGSQFTFTLPLAREVRSEDIRRKPVPVALPLSPVLAPRHNVASSSGPISILVADDEPLNCQVVADALSMQGYSVVTVGDGQAAVDAVARQDFSLLILDVMMPKLSGFDVCRRVRESWPAHELPILLLSAKNRPEDVATGLAAGANDYIGKPVERSELMARVKNLLAVHELNAARREREKARLVQEACDRLARYFPPPLVQRLLSEPDAGKLQAERRRLTVLFADLVEFTALTDRFEPEIITDLLNQFLGGMGALVEKFGGTLNELLGDGLVVLFGAPEKMDKDEQAERAVALAVAMQREIARLKKAWLEAGIDHNIDLRIGIHQDFATVGNFGSGRFLAYRAVGSGVNLAARLQSHCPPGQVLVSYPVYALTRERYPYDDLQEVRIKGFAHAHRVGALNPERVSDARLHVISGAAGSSGNPASG